MINLDFSKIDLIVEIAHLKLDAIDLKYEKPKKKITECSLCARRVLSVKDCKPSNKNSLYEAINATRQAQAGLSGIPGLQAFGFMTGGYL